MWGWEGGLGPGADGKTFWSPSTRCEHLIFGAPLVGAAPKELISTLHLAGLSTADSRVS